LRIVVDGYNVARWPGLVRPEERRDLEAQRTALLERLAAYRRARGHAITVVFDGRDAPPGLAREASHRGVAVRYSRGGETADQVIARQAREAGPGLVVVTSDRELARAVEHVGATAISAEAFAAKLEAAELAAQKGGEDDEAGRPRPERGSPRRPDKAGRRRRAALDRL
jgi:predicted RNA-binding protein with PIN domain